DWVELQIAVAYTAWQSRCGVEFGKREVILAEPGMSKRGLFDYNRAVNRVLCNRQKFRSTARFVNGLFTIAETSVDKTEHGQPFGVARLLPQNILQFSTSTGECFPCGKQVSAQPCDKSFEKSMRIGEAILVTISRVQSRQCLLRFFRIAFAQC